jgi:hypothetical protein
VTPGTIQFPLIGERVRIDRSSADGGALIVRVADGQTVGHLTLEPAGPTLTIRELCIDAPYRSYGSGSETGFLMVRAAEQAGYELLRAWAPPDLGLSVYFWIRMGFHPLHGEGPKGGIWLERRPLPKPREG